MDLEFKEKVYQYGLSLLLDKQSNLQKEIAALRDGIANDSKSSMGDKYETSREMSQQEINRLEQQFAINQQHLFNLKNLAFQNRSPQILLGSLVVTNIGSFFITVSLGEVKIENQSVFMISPGSPIGKLLIGKNVGDNFEMNKKLINIIAIF
ncbi:hypothetical protein A5893_04275 [Pedobacter psychrophilus]|uniref:3-oxoacyl-ACP synthase n=1 Tax=Pedobacter psychrophilus TaxID=1826909 RepID=A0A179DP83_9SPHI|nr:GreA/GreB family elongation factor [Pedobacter psychrophilus]OAQ42333.1 hypothetical protein A5893_04275 [Pedobacter psychrophilus]